MPYLSESNEWELLDKLGRLWYLKKSRYQPLRDHKGVEVNAELVEFELRHVFIAKQVTRNLEPEEFDQFQAKVQRLCLLLDGLARVPNADVGPEDLAYPRLRALTELLKSKSGKLDVTA